MRIPQSTIAEIQDAADIVEVVNDFVTLKKKGKDYKACCPFHNEKTPSFSVSPQRNIFKCFGCGKGGDAITFVMEIDNVSYVEALKYLAKKYQIEIPEEAYEAPTDQELQAQNEKDSLLIALNKAKDFFVQQLFETDEGKTIGLNYFKERGFQEKTLKTFEIGYSPETWDALHKYLTALQFKPEILEKAGLSIKKDGTNNYFDRFRDRVIFPIHNISGRIVGFGGRTLKKAKNIAKYINSPETPVYEKSRTLYGLFQAKQQIRQVDECYLVEGYADTIALHQAGITNVVASSGTSLTVEQIKLLKRFTSHVTILYDGDEAGLKASMRGVDLVLEEGLSVHLVVFPDGEDPDSYVQKVGVNAFQDFIKTNKKDFISFKTMLLLQGVANDPFKRGEAIKEVVSTIVKIPDPIQRNIFYQTCSNLFRVDEQVLISEGNKILKGNIYKKNKQEAPSELPETTSESPTPETEVETKTSQFDKVTLQEKECIRLLLNYADYQIDEVRYLAEYILQELGEIEFSYAPYQTILHIYKDALESGKVLNANYFIQEQNDPILKQVVIDLVTDKHELSEGWYQKKATVPKKDEFLSDVTYTHLMRLKFRFVQKMIDENMKNIKNATEEADLEKYMQMHLSLKNTEKEIAKILGNVIR